jgi:hypothetical protein
MGGSLSAITQNIEPGQISQFCGASVAASVIPVSVTIIASVPFVSKSVDSKETLSPYCLGISETV